MATMQNQYVELTEDELIELAAQKTELLSEIKSEMVLRDTTDELVQVVAALKARRDATAEARRRIGNYLRHAALQQLKYDRDMASDSDYARRNAKAPTENIDSLWVDQWTKAGELRLSDLQRVVSVVTFDGQLDGEKLFYETQADRLEQWKAHPDYAKLSEKQQALLQCIADQHVSSGYNGWTHDSRSSKQYECYTRIHQGTMNSLLKKTHIVGSRTLPGMAVHRTSYLVLKAPPQN